MRHRVEGEGDMQPGQNAAGDAASQRIGAAGATRGDRTRDLFFAHQGARLPWVTLPELGLRLAGHRLFRYMLPRLSLWQDRWMRLDGVVGYMDLEGELTPAVPFLRAIEILHFGQKATFGLGEVRVFQM